MTTISISYSTYDPANQANERILGAENIDNIEEILIPFNEKNTPIFITKAFSGEPCKRWRVAFVLGIAPDHWGIWLTEKNISNDIYLSQIMVTRGIRNPRSIVRKGAIVIVEFGHIYQTLNFLTGLSQSAMYPCSHQEGEMHKRRPAIVVKVDNRGITIVPITSKEPDAHKFNRALFELEAASTADIKEFSLGKRSFAVCEMIQTVSPTRILPPESRDHRGKNRAYRRDVTFSRRLSVNDMQALDHGLLTAVAMNSLRENHDQLIKKESVQSSELGRLRPSEAQLQKELAILKKKHHILTQLYQAVSEHTAAEDIEQEIDEYMGLD